MWKTVKSQLRAVRDRFRPPPGASTSLASDASRPVDVLVFPVIDWDYRFQRPQHLSLELARAGHRVFYLSTDFVRDDLVLDPQPRTPTPNIFVCKLPGGVEPPRIDREVPNEAQLTAMEGGVRALRHKFSIGTTLSIVDFPYWLPLTRQLGNHVVLYDCMDDYASFENTGPETDELEREMFKTADLVVCSSEYLRGKARRVAGRESVLIRNAAEPSHFERPPERLALEPDGRTVGYFGAMNHWTDIELLIEAAQRLPRYRFVLIGSTLGSDVRELTALPNVTLVGEVPYARLPEYVHGFDVCLIPYRICEYALASDPVKLWEYFAAGKPVVSVRFPEVEWLEGRMTLASDREEFIAGIERESAEDSPEKAAERRAFARQHTWARRASDLRAEAERLFPQISVIIVCWNQQRFTQAALHSIDLLTGYPNLEIVVVDNGSTDETPEFLSAYGRNRTDVRVLRNRENRGFAAGSNQGVRAASGEYFVLLNNDVYVTEGWAADLLAHFRAEPRLGLLGPVTNRSGNEQDITIRYGGHGRDGDGGQALHTVAAKTTNIVAGSSSVLHDDSANGLERGGELDEGYGMGLFEDDDYTMRARAAGYEIACAEDVFIHHHGSASLATLGKDGYDDLFAKNRARFEGSGEPGRRRWAGWTNEAGYGGRMEMREAVPTVGGCGLRSCTSPAGPSTVRRLRGGRCRGCSFR